MPRRPVLLAAGVVVLLLVLAAVRISVVDTVSVTSASMRPALEPGDRLVVLRTTEIEAGDIVVFDGAGLLGAEPATAYVKRVVGVPGDHVRCCTGDGRIVRNGVPLDEPYVTGRSDGVEFDVTVPADRYWVLGDNRAESADSRSALGRPGGGMLRADDVVGEVLWRYWPRERVGGIDSPQVTTLSRTGTGPRAVSAMGDTAQDIDLQDQPKERVP